MSNEIPFHHRVFEWAIMCFGQDDARNKKMRNDRFVEEALELVQSLGYTQDEVARVSDYVFNRPPGQPMQEVGGTMVTLAALCAANGIDLRLCSENELLRVYQNIDIIRKKHAAKPKFQPEPVRLMTITEERAEDRYPVELDPEHWTALNIDDHHAAIFVVTKMDGDGDCKAGQKVVEFLKQARIPA